MIGRLFLRHFYQYGARFSYSYSKKITFNASVPIFKIIPIKSKELMTVSVCSILSFFKVKEDEKEDPIVMNLKRGKLAEMRDDYETASSYYHKALRQILKDQKSGARTDKEIAGARLTTFCLMVANKKIA